MLRFDNIVLNEYYY